MQFNYREMLTYCRPHGSKTERKFIAKYLLTLPGAVQDAFGNVLVYVAGAGDNVLWSAHTDTVHRQGGRQRVILLDGDYQLLNTKCGSGCLGADNTSGVWLLCEMIAAGKPGHYIFHRAEECGALGSKALASSGADWIKQCQYAIAFDRRGFTSVITHQMSERCCSEKFAAELCAHLNQFWIVGLPNKCFAPDDGGSFTDTAEYTELIPECTNISIGYQGAHSSNETQDAAFLEQMLNAILALDVSKLGVYRDPSVHEYENWAGSSGVYKGRYGGRYRSYSPSYSEREDVEIMEWERAHGYTELPIIRADSDPIESEIQRIKYFCTEYPCAVATYLRDFLGVTPSDLIDGLIDCGADLSVFDYARGELGSAGRGGA